MNLCTTSRHYGGSMKLRSLQSCNRVARHAKTTPDTGRPGCAVLHEWIAHQYDVAASDRAAVLHPDFLPVFHSGRHIIAVHNINPVAKHKPQHHSNRRRQNQRQKPT